MRHTLPLSTHGMGHRKPIRLGVIASIIWSSCVGLYRHPNFGNQGEWCDLAATTPKTRILLYVMGSDRPLLFSLTQWYRLPGAAGPSPAAKILEPAFTPADLSSSFFSAV